MRGSPLRVWMVGARAARCSTNDGDCSAKCQRLRRSGGSIVREDIFISFVTAADCKDRYILQLLHLSRTPTATSTLPATIAVIRDPQQRERINNHPLFRSSPAPMPATPAFHGVTSMLKFFLHLFFLQASCNTYFCNIPHPTSAPVPSPTALHPIPPRLLVGYANWAQCDSKIVRAVRQGLNVVVWFSINLSKDTHGNPIIDGAVPDLDCVAGTISSLRRQNLSVTHLISIGGWNSPLPDASFSAERWFQVFHDWNTKTVARPRLAWHGFNGIDWDSEGNDNTSNPANIFDIQHMRLIGHISVLAKRAGYIVSIAPIQSYLNAFTEQFSLRVDFPPLHWMPEFKYHGRNLYAFWLSEYGRTKLSTGEEVPTFDWVALQLYEGWSDANYEIVVKNNSPKDYFRKLIQAMHDGWTVRFSDEPRLNISAQTVHVPPTRLIIGLANGWTKPYPPTQKFLLLQPAHLAEAYSSLPDSLKPRGFMFWNIADEGQVIAGKELFLTKELNKILDIRRDTS